MSRKAKTSLLALVAGVGTTSLIWYFGTNPWPWATITGACATLFVIAWRHTEFEVELKLEKQDGCK